MRIYLDSAPVIYTIEMTAPWFATVDARLSVAGVIRVASELTRMECLVKPLANGNAALARDFDDYFANAVSKMVPFTRPLFDKAADLRVRYRFKTPDALHLAAAIVSGCDALLTNDQQLTRCTDIPVEVI